MALSTILARQPLRTVSALDGFQISGVKPEGEVVVRPAALRRPSTNDGFTYRLEPKVSLAECTPG
jgi:hypothetical protein